MSRYAISFAVCGLALAFLCTGCPAPGDAQQPDDQQPDNADPTTPDTQDPADGGTETFTLMADEFENNGAIPIGLTGDGADQSPTLFWANAPANTVEFALICDDPDAPTDEPWVHWVAYKIPATVGTLDGGLPTTEELTDPAGALQGENSWEEIGYGGPMPPEGDGAHHYNFVIYALDAALEVEAGLTKDELLAAMGDHVIAEATLTGTYER